MLEFWPFDNTKGRPVKFRATLSIHTSARTATYLNVINLPLPPIRHSLSKNPKILC